MRLPTTIAAIAAVAPVINAHDGPGIPKIGGLNMRDLKARNLMDNIRARTAELTGNALHEEHALKPRQGGTNGQCGAGYGSCDAGYCCSGSGWCGTSADYCYSPGCNYAYGPGCPENVTPAGADTSSVARTALGSIAYGGDGIYQCTVPGTVALTFDDGPFDNYTDHILDLFAKYNAKGTFFITGNNINKGEIDTTASHTATIKRMASEGHQIASHTWTHLDLSAISETDRKAQMIKNEMALRNILGYFPTYMRPPYSSCTAASGCETTMSDLGYHVVYFNVDTDDYNQLEATQIQNSKNYFKGNITANGATSTNNEWLSIAHDIHPQTAYNLTEYMLTTLTTLGYKAVTVGECLGDDAANWYRATSGTTSTTTTQTSSAATASASSTKKVSTDGTCAGTSGYTCQGSTFGNCCSQYGWCGSTTDHCSTGCQSAFGTCGTSSSAAASSTKAASSSTKAASSSTKAASTSTKAVSTSTKAASTSTKAASTSTKAASTSTKAASSSTKATATPSSTAKVSTDGTCSGTTGYTCTGSTFGNCCSQYGWCGSTTGHCGTGCNKSYGTCS